MATSSRRETAEEREIREDEQAAERIDADRTDQGFIEYVGEPGDPYGTEFIDARVISRKDAKDGWDISIPKDLRWTKDAKGRMRLPLSEIPAEARDLLLAGKSFKLVTEE